MLLFAVKNCTVRSDRWSIILWPTLCNGTGFWSVIHAYELSTDPSSSDSEIRHNNANTRVFRVAVKMTIDERRTTVLVSALVTVCRPGWRLKVKRSHNVRAPITRLSRPPQRWRHCDVYCDAALT